MGMENIYYKYLEKMRRQHVGKGKWSEKEKKERLRKEEIGKEGEGRNCIVEELEDKVV